MKIKSIALIFLTTCIAMISLGALAQDRRFGRDEFERRPHPDAHYHPSMGWLVPALIGGALIYEATQAANPPAVVVQPAPQPANQYYPVQPNQVQTPPVGYHWEQIADANCNCQRVVLVQNR
jgi:hypothetical protein